ncbi:MAG: hypothetical protein ACRESK_03605 [Gammaproteobacteria bacterium]
MQNLKAGDLVLVINSLYHPGLIGHVGTVVHGEGHVSGMDKFGQLVSGPFVIVDLVHDINRHGTNLWYFRATHLLRITPGDSLQDLEAETGPVEKCH